MHARFAPGSGKPPVGQAVRMGRLAILMPPVILLLLVSWRIDPGMTNMVLWVGTLVQALACLVALSAGRLGREPVGPAVIMLYVVAISWLLLGAPGKEDWLLHLAQATLLVVPLTFFAIQCLHDSGATTMRRARQLASRLATRTDWPADLMECRLLPEVKALRESLHIDATPALELLANPRPAVRVAALAALEFRPNWRPGQPEVVRQLARRAPEPEVRAAAVYALANVDDRILIESLAELLRDPSSLVRQTASDALLWNTEQRWSWIRDAVHTALADSDYQDDGGLRVAGNQLSAESLTDFHAWTAEKGVVGMRAALTLGIYYGQLLTAGTSIELVESLRKQLTDPRTPGMFRLELARLLNQYRELDEEDLRQLLDQGMPAPVRLIAVEALLSLGPCPHALAAVHSLARLPNREIALATADVVQRRMGIDMGLPRGQALPPIHSRIAAEVARRLLAWATQHDVADAEVGQESQPSYRPSSTSSSRVDL